MSDTTIATLTVDRLRETLQQAGYRVETMTDPVANRPYLHSATSGLAFDIRVGNRLADAEGSFLDVVFTAALQVQGELPLDIVNRWNVTRRFARLLLSPPFLVICMDVTVAGGVTPAHLRAHVEIWDSLVQELVAYLREELSKLAPTNGANAPTSAEPARTAQADETGMAETPVTVQ